MSNVTKALVFIITTLLLFSSSAFAQDEEEIRIVFVIHGTSEPNIFWDPVKNGAEAAAAELGITVDYQAAEESIGRMIILIDEAVASEPDGLIVSMGIDEVKPSIAAATEAGIPVILVNQSPEVVAELGALTYIGEDPYAGGFGAGERLTDAGATHVLCISPGPDVPVLQARCQGTIDAMAASGGSAEVLPIDPANPDGIIDLISEALSADSSVDALLTMGSFLVPHALQSVDEAGLLGEVLVASFDLSPESLEAVRDGDMLFAIDQQPYLQGYLPVVYLKLFIENLNTPGSLMIQTGPNFVTAENAEEVIQLSAARTR